MWQVKIPDRSVAEIFETVFRVLSPLHMKGLIILQNAKSIQEDQRKCSDT